MERGLNFLIVVIVLVGPVSGVRGAEIDAQGHWSFEPVSRPVLPADGAGWSESAIDRFVSAGHREQGLAPVGLADKRTLIRRISFDIIGLPPSPEEISSFLADNSPDALSRLLDRLVASPHYGERWGRHWMDVVHYADTAGDNADYPVPEARFYRDYIIDSFNADKPYDEFVQEQIAGDILARQGSRDRYADRVVATGFLALSRRYLTAPYERWHLTLEDTIQTTGQAFMGLTLRCARCHDHKFDPVTTEDYYALYGIFASTAYPYAGSEEFKSQNYPRKGFIPLVPAAEAAPLYESHAKRLEELEADIARRQAELKDETDDARKKELTKNLTAVETRLINLRRPGLPGGVDGAYAVGEGQPKDVEVHLVGDPTKKGVLVKRRAPAFLDDAQLDIPEGASGRLELARWLTRPEHPLTARVMVNRIWHHHFGNGIVATPSNFGLQGVAPSHPELLDHLAARFVDNGWSVKAMHRTIVLSRTYRLSSANDPVASAVDPANRWYWHFDRRRLEAEAIRDAMLIVSGDLDNGRPSRHPFPTIDTWTWSQHNPFKGVYRSRHRSVYLMTQRLHRHPFLALFDSPDTNTTTGARESSTLPLQALYMMNNSFVKEQSEGLARRLIAAVAEPTARIELAHQLAWGRAPKSVEVEKALRFVDRYRDELLKAAVPSDQVETEAWASFARVMLTANEFVYVD